MKQQKFLRYTLLLFMVSCCGIFIRCTKDDDTNNQNHFDASNWKIYKNQTGNPQATALQAQCVNSTGTLNIYGNFDSNDNPDEIHTMTYQMTGNDTLVNMVIDPVFNRIKSIFTTVNGTKQPTVIKFDHGQGGIVNVSIHNYNWSTNSAEMLYAANVSSQAGIYTSNPIYAGKVANTATTSSWGNLGVLASSIAITEAIYLAAGLQGYVVAALGTAAAPIIATVGTIGVVVGVATIALAVITSDANASELGAADIPYPDGIPVQNPVPQEDDPTDNLPVSDCLENVLVYNVFMDGEGTIVIETPSEGGTAPYTYLLQGENGFVDIGIYPGEYQNGNYFVAVKDANGCITSKVVTLNRDCGDTDLAITATVEDNSATATATGGEPPYTYEWSNGSTGASANSLADGEYSVTVTDNNGCTKSTTIVIGVETVTDIDGNVYNVVTIGSQKWIQSNLDVSHYRNGDEIQYVTNMSTWVSLTTGAYCYYSFQSSNGLIYGKLYNYYAMKDPRGLAPEGWHIPDGDEFNTLREAADHSGKNLATTTGWSGGAGLQGTNNTGFTALPGGCMGVSFSFKGEKACFGYDHELDNQSYLNILQISTIDINSIAYQGEPVHMAAFSIRCIKD